MFPVFRNPQNGQWYLSVTCPTCNHKMLLFRDLNDGHGNTNGSCVVTCPRCNREQSLALEHYQHSERRRPGALRLVS